MPKGLNVNGMKYFRFHGVIVFVALAATLTLLSFDARPTLGQSPAGEKPTVKSTVLVPKGSNDSALNASPAARNAALSTELTWKFGSKEQHGWYLYTSLIKRTIDTKDDPSSKGFAAALAR